MASTKLTRTPSSVGNSKTWTYSMWIKLGNITTEYVLFHNYGSSGSDEVYAKIGGSSGVIDFALRYGGTYEGRLITNRKFRDPSAWYHLVFACDTTSGTATNRQRIYVNGVEETDFSTDTQIAQDAGTVFNQAYEHTIGSYGSGNYFDGEMAHVHFCDGYAYAASDFGETDSTSGIWIAKTSPSVSYGNNGIFLKFASGATLTDSSGNGNNMTLGGGTLTALKDSPDNNWSTWNPLYQPTGNYPTFANCNTTCTSQNSSGKYWGSASTLGMQTGKWYAEFKAVTASNKPSFGVTQAPGLLAYNQTYLGNRNYDYAYISDGGIYNNNNETAAWGNTFTTGDIVMVALDLDNNKIYFGKNGTWENSGDPTSGATGTGAAYTVTSVAAATAANDWNSPNSEGAYFFACSDQSTGGDTMAANFGNGFFETTAVTSAGNSSTGDDSVWEYDCPAGYYGLNTINMATYG